MDRKELGDIFLNAAAAQGAAQREADEAARPFEEYCERMDKRCAVVSDIMAPLVQAELFIKTMIDAAAASVKNHYIKRQPIFVFPSVVYDRTQHYLGASQYSNDQWSDWKAYTNMRGAFVVGCHSRAMNQDSRMKIILGLVEIVDGNYSGVNFITRSQKIVPALEIDIMVSSGAEPSYRVKYTDAEKLELLDENRGSRVTLQDRAPDYTPSLTARELAEFIYGRIIKSLNVDLRSFFQAGGEKPGNALSAPRRELP